MSHPLNDFKYSLNSTSGNEKNLNEGNHMSHGNDSNINTNEHLQELGGESALDIMEFNTLLTVVISPGVVNPSWIR